MSVNLTTKRQNAANKAIEASTKIVDGLNDLIEVALERAKWSEDFQPNDFIGTLVHVDSGIMGTLLDAVTTSLKDNYVDTSNSGRNQQILLQVRR